MVVMVVTVATKLTSSMPPLPSSLVVLVLVVARGWSLLVGGVFFLISLSTTITQNSTAIATVRVPTRTFKHVRNQRM